MGVWLRITVLTFVSMLRSRRNLALENVALRQQLMVLRRQSGSGRWLGRSQHLEHRRCDDRRRERIADRCEYH